MGRYAHVFRSKTKSQSGGEWFQSLHLPVKPGLSVRTEPICPAYPGAQIFNTQAPEPVRSHFQPRIFKVKPLTDSHPCRETFRRKFGSAIFTQQAHVVVPVIGAAL